MVRQIHRGDAVRRQRLPPVPQPLAHCARKLTVVLADIAWGTERAELAEQLGVGTEVIYNWCVSIQLINGGMLTMGTQVQKSHTKDEEESTVWAHAPVSSTRHQSALDYGREVDVIYRRAVGQLLYLRLLIHIS